MLCTLFAADLNLLYIIRVKMVKIESPRNIMRGGNEGRARIDPHRKSIVRRGTHFVREMYVNVIWPRYLYYGVARFVKFRIKTYVLKDNMFSSDFIGFE